QLRSAKNPNLPRPTHPVLSTPWLAALELLCLNLNIVLIILSRLSSFSMLP
ncbi:hypothetical protein K661_02277, partial [Piscirickettsia salmonis LF-89 = ATCC VR-1361]